MRRISFCLTLLGLILAFSPLMHGQGSTHTCKYNAGPKSGQTESFPNAPPVAVGSPCQDGVSSSGAAVPDPTLTHTCKYNAGPKNGQTESFPNAPPVAVGSPCQDGVSSSGVAVPDPNSSGNSGGNQGGGLTHTCKYNAGPKKGQTESFPNAPPVAVGSPCQDGVSSSGVAVPDPNSSGNSGGNQGGGLTHTCKYDAGPKNGQTEKFPNAKPVSVGSPCQDGVSSSGVAVPD